MDTDKHRWEEGLNANAGGLSIGDNSRQGLFLLSVLIRVHPWLKNRLKNWEDKFLVTRYVRATREEIPARHQYRHPEQPHVPLQFPRARSVRTHPAHGRPLHVARNFRT